MNRVYGIAVALALSASSAFCAHAHWGYGPDNSDWGHISDKYKICDIGKTQSPIDIDTGHTKAASNDIRLSYKSDSTDVLNNGHAIQVNYTPGSAVTFKGKTYNLIQLHFHTPAENMIDNKRYPLEMHLVHQNEDKELLVVGVMFKEGKNNAELSKILAQAPKEEGKVKLNKSVDPNALVPKYKSYYAFKGSLTTPPCTEGVQWIVLKNAVEASRTQINDMHDILHDVARPVQATNNRLIESAN